jgi:hypothetical protein
LTINVVAQLNALPAESTTAVFSPVVSTATIEEADSQTADASKNAAMFNEGEQVTDTLGGIDLNRANLDLYIKRDGQGVPLPVSNQNLAQLSKILGFTPIIIEILPATNPAVFNFN